MLRHKIIILFSLCTLTGFNTVRAQFDSLNYSVSGNNFLKSHNTALLNGLNISTVSCAEIQAQGYQGGFKNFSEGEKTAALKLKAESFYRFNPKVSGYGKISYENFSGKQTTGAAFLDPENAPFNIIEQADTNAGQQKRETYEIIGGLSIKTWKNLSLGAKFEYTAANNAKRKDLRHKNSLMDLTGSLGISYDFNFLNLGCAYIYRRRNEDIRFSVKGTSDKVYNSIISYGCFFGLREEFGEEGFTDKSRELPLFDSYQGGSFQVLLKITDNIKWFNEFEYFLRSGHYGQKSQYTVELTQHEAEISALKGSVFFSHNSLIQSINYAFEEETLYNYRNICNSEAFEGGLTNYIYYDKTKTSGKNPINFSAEYSAFYFYDDKILSLKVGSQYQHRKTYAVRYPFWRVQDIKTKTFYAEIGHENDFLKGRFSKVLGVKFAKGSGKPYENGYTETPSEDYTRPVSQDDFLMQEYEYLCKPHVMISSELKYTQKIFSDKIYGYIAVNYAFTTAKNTKYLKKLF